MFEIDRIPIAVKEHLNQKGVAYEKVVLAAYADRNREHTPCETYLFATDKELYILSGVCVSAAHPAKKYGNMPKLESGFFEHTLAPSLSPDNHLRFHSSP